MLRKHSRQSAQARPLPLTASLLAALLCSACAQTGEGLTSLDLANSAALTPVDTAALPAPARPPAPPAEISARPQTATVIREARSLRGMGRKAEALALLDKAAGADTEPALIAERGLLALEIGQIDKAERLLAKAQDPKAPNWRLQSAYGAALSAAGKQSEAQAQFVKALALAPEAPSVLNNLALSYALEGKQAEAERVLRQAAAHAAEPQAKQNLALILGLNGKVEEAAKIAQSTLPPETAKSNIAYFKTLQSAQTAVSPAESGSTAGAFRAASASASSERPIMSLGMPE